MRSKDTLYLKLNKTETKNTGPDGSVVMASANGLVGTGFASRYQLQIPERVFKDPTGRCVATTPSSLSLTSNRVTTGVCVYDRRVL